MLYQVLYGPPASGTPEAVSGTATQGVGAPPQGAQGVEVFSGPGTQGVGAPPQSASGMEEFAGSSTQGVNAPPQDAVAVEVFSATATQVVGAPPQSAEGSTVSGPAPITGEATQGVEAPPTSAEGTVVTATPVEPLPGPTGGGGSLFPSDIYWEPRKKKQPGKRRKRREPTRTDADGDEPEDGLVVRRDEDEDQPPAPRLGVLPGSPDWPGASLAPPDEAWRPRDSGEAVAVAPPRPLATVGAGTQGLRAPDQSLRGFVSDDNLVLTVLLLDDD